MRCRIGSIARPTLVALALALAGCAGIIVPDIDDLELAGLEAITTPGPAERAADLESRNFYPALIINVTTATDLLDFGRRHYVSIRPDAKSCVAPRDERPLATFQTFDRYGEVGYVGSRQVDSPADRPDASGRRVYRSLLKVSDGADRSDGTPPIAIGRPAYDLRQEPPDLCFRLRGGNMLMAHYVSNTVRIPAAMIRAALDRAGLRPE